MDIKNVIGSGWLRKYRDVLALGLSNSCQQG